MSTMRIWAKNAVAMAKNLYLYALSRVCIRFFIFLHSHPSTGVPQLVRAQLGRQVRANMAWWMSQNGIVHCWSCLSHRTTLHREQDGKYYCDAHRPMVKA